MTALDLLARALGASDDRLAVVLDDVTGSGTSMREALRGSKDKGANPGLQSHWEGPVRPLPLVGGSEAEGVIRGLVPLSGPVSVRPMVDLTASPWFRALHPEQRRILRTVLSTLGAGFAGGAFMLALPYMSPNNDWPLFTRLLAHLFLLNQNMNAAKRPPRRPAS